MRDIAGEAGLSTGVLYRYFRDKEALIEAITELATGQQSRFIAELGTGLGGEAQNRLVDGLFGLLDQPEAETFARLGAGLYGHALDSEETRLLLLADLNNLRGNVGRVSEECTQEPHRPQLNPEAKAVGVSPPLLYELSVGIVQGEEPLQLRSGGRSLKSPIGDYLLIGEEFNRHARSTDAMPAKGTRLLRGEALRIASLPRRFDSAGVVVPTHEGHHPVGWDSVDYRETGQGRAGSPATVTAGDFDALVPGSVQGFGEDVLCLRAVAGQPEVRPAQPPALPWGARR